MEFPSVGGLSSIGTLFAIIGFFVKYLVDIAVLKTRLGSIDKRLDQQNGRVDKLEGTVGGHSAELAENRGRRGHE